MRSIPKALPLCSLAACLLALVMVIVGWCTPAFANSGCTCSQCCCNYTGVVDGAQCHTTGSNCTQPSAACTSGGCNCKQVRSPTGDDEGYDCSDVS